MTSFILPAALYDQCVREFPGFENNPYYVREQHTRPLRAEGFLLGDLRPIIELVQLWLLPDGEPPGVPRSGLNPGKQ